MDMRDSARSNGPHNDGFNSFDPDRMMLSITIEDEDEDGPTGDYEFPARYEVCDLCDGRGKHVNPSIDAHGVSDDEFRDDPEFAMAYFNGAHDVTCYECRGRRVVPVVDEDRIEPERIETYMTVRAWMERLAAAKYQDALEAAAERRYIYGF